MASDIVADAKAWLEWRPPHRSSQDGRTHSGDCHRVHVDCLIARLVADVERHRMTPQERGALRSERIRLMVEVERHRMTPEERVAMERARDFMQLSTIDLARHTAGALSNYLDRTATEAK